MREKNHVSFFVLEIVTVIFHIEWGTKTNRVGWTLDSWIGIDKYQRAFYRHLKITAKDFFIVIYIWIWGHLGMDPWRIGDRNWNDLKSWYFVIRCWGKQSIRWYFVWNDKVYVDLLFQISVRNADQEGKTSMIYIIIFL